MSSTAVAQFEVSVLYNGITKVVKVNSRQAVQAVLQHALNEFGIRRNRTNFALFNEKGQQLSNSTSVGDAGISPGDELLLRPLRVSGGS